jgi:RNA polymerase sigma-70 factor (ECF subfamily)
MNDIEAVRRLRRGDITGLESLVQRYQVQAVRAAFFVTQDAALAEDVVQDTFLHLYRGAAGFDETRPLAPYLMRAVLNRALNAVRSRSKTSSLDGDPTALEQLLTQNRSIENEVELAEQGQAVLEALAQLPPRQRAAIVQRYYFDWSEREMADAMQIPAGTIKWLLHSARTRLRELLGSERSPE